MNIDCNNIDNNIELIYIKIGQEMLMWQRCGLELIAGPIQIN